MLLRTLKMSFWVVYDHLGKLLFLNILSACCVVVPLLYALKVFADGNLHKTLFISFPITAITLVFTVPVIQVGLLWMLKEIIEKKDGSLKTYFMGIRLFGIRAACLGFVYVMSTICLLTSVWFYGARLGKWSPLAGYGLSAIAAWVCLFLLLSSIMVLPSLVNKNAGIGGSMKIAAVLLIDNPLFMAGLAAHAFILLAFCIAPPVFLLFSFAPLAALQSSAYEMLSRKYAAITEHASKTGKIDKSIAIDFGDENDEYLCRGFRDLLFPWKE